MPTTTEILNGLTAIANDWRTVAIGWHLAVAAMLVALALGFRPTGSLIALLPMSVAVFALGYGNPFNGIVFAALAVALVALSRRDASTRPQAWARLGGAVMIAFAWFYPHFLAGSPLQYLYAAPVGLVPCPTLAMALGLALLTGAGGKRWSWLLAGVSTFYALFGVFRLGVALDLGLLAGAMMLGLSTVRR